MSHLKKLRVLLPLAFVGCWVSTGASAAVLTNPDPKTCTVDSFSINSMEKSPLGPNNPIDPNDVIFTGFSINSTSCFGLVSGNDDQGGLNEPDPNIGELEDGLLNGEKNKDGDWLSPTQFITSDQLLDLDGDNVATDPGWIFLGSVGGLEGTSSYTMDGYDKPLSIDDILSLTMTCTGGEDGDKCVQGTWTLETKLDIIEKVQAVLGRNSFDHLAFVIKSGTSWAVYDFDFNILLEQLLDAGGAGFDYTTPYSFTGSWNTDDFVNKKLNPQEFSHISVWVRDPLPTQQIPEPGTLALMGLALLGFGAARYRKSR